MLPDAIQPARIANVVAEELKMSHRKAAHHSFHVKWVKCAKDFRKIEGQQIRQKQRSLVYYRKLLTKL